MTQNKLIILASILIFLCACVAFAGGLGLGFGLSDAFEAATTDEGETAAYEPPAERPASKGQLLFEDDFSGEAWAVHQDDNHRKGYEADQYFIVVETTSYSYWSTAGETYADFVLEVETEQVEGPIDNDYGVILRYQDDANFYSFEISGDGYYTFNKLVQDEFYAVIPWQESDVIRTGDSQNMLRVEAVGSNFSLYINDELVDVAIDSDFSQGDIGLLAGAYEEAGVHIAFDNLKVWAVE